MTAVILFSSFVLFLLYLENRILKLPKYSPFFWFSVPIAVIILLSNLIGVRFGFFPVSTDAVYINIMGLSSFWIGGLLVSKSIHVYTKNIRFIPKSNFIFMYFFAAFVIAIALINLKSILGSRSIFQLEDQEFGQSGIMAHISNYITICTIFFVAALYNKIYKSKKIIIAALILCIVIKFSTAIKAELMLPIIASIIFLLVQGKIKITIPTILIGILSIAFLFISMGLFFNIGTKDNPMEYALAFFFFYAICGEVGLSEWISSHPNWIPADNADLVTVFFYNIYEKIFGYNEMVTYSKFAHQGWIPISDDYFGIPFSTNVFSLIGEVYLNCGLFVGSVYFFLLGIYFYIIFSFAKKSLFLLIWYSYISGILALSFFSSYVLFPAFIEIQIVCFILYGLSVSNQTKSKALIRN